MSKAKKNETIDYYALSDAEKRVAIAKDVIERIAAAGGIVAYDPAAAVEHFVPPDRLTQAWFRRRMAWQAVSDYLRKPEEHLARRDQHWQAAKDFVFDCPPADRTLRSLALHSDDPEHLRRQAGAIYDAVISLLAGLDDIGESLQHAGAITAFEEKRKLAQPWLA